MESKESRALYQFFSRTVRPFFLLTGAGTALVGLYAFLPSWAMPNVAKLPYLQDYTIIVQHWGIMVGIMGICMMLAAIVPEWRVPILLYSAFEKAFMVWQREEVCTIAKRENANAPSPRATRRAGSRRRPTRPWRSWP